jgi:hypothetical protein
MKKLKDTVSKNGFIYNCVQRTATKAIYQQTHENIQVGFEVFLIRVRGAQFSHLLHKSLPPSEKFPSNEDFGKTAWSYRSLQAAIKKYEEL